MNTLKESKNKCPSRRKLSSYGDGELSSKEREILESHFEQCLNCRSIVNDFAYITRLLEKTEKADLSEHFELKLRKRLAKEKTDSGIVFRRVLIPLGAVALGIFALFSGGIIGKEAHKFLSGVNSEQTNASFLAVNEFFDHPKGSISEIVLEVTER